MGRWAPGMTRNSWRRPACTRRGMEGIPWRPTASCPATGTALMSLPGNPTSNPRRGASGGNGMRRSRMWDCGGIGLLGKGSVIPGLLQGASPALGGSMEQLQVRVGSRWTPAGPGAPQLELRLPGLEHMERKYHSMQIQRGWRVWLPRSRGTEGQAPGQASLVGLRSMWDLRCPWNEWCSQD